MRRPHAAAVAALLLLAPLPGGRQVDAAATRSRRKKPPEWLHKLYSTEDDWAQNFWPDARRTLPLPAGPLESALPVFAAGKEFRQHYFEKLGVVLEAEAGPPPLSLAKLYAKKYHLGNPTASLPHFPRNVHFAQGGFHNFVKPPDLEDDDVVERAEIKEALGRGETAWFNDIHEWEPAVRYAPTGSEFRPRTAGKN